MTSIARNNSPGNTLAVARPSTWIATGLLVVATGMIAFLFASTLFLPGHERLPGQLGSIGDAVSIIVSMAAFVTLPVVGAMLAIRRPRNAIGWLLLVSGVSVIFGTFAQEYVRRSVILEAELPGYRVVDLVGPLSLALGFALLPIWIPLLFPDGRLPSRRWRPVAWLAAATMATNAVASFVALDEGDYGQILPSPLALDPAIVDVANVWVDLSNLFLVGFIAVAMVSMIARFRRSAGVEREQMKWFLAAIVVVAVAIFAMATTQQEWAYFAFLGATSLVPIAIGIAVMRYRLYDIDRIISRTIGWAIVSGTLVAAFVGLVIGLQAVLASLTAGNTLAVAVSTLVAAALFGPLRALVQRAVDRRFDRTRYDGERLIADFGERLRDEVELATIERDVLATVDAAVRPSRVALGLRGRAERAR